MRLIPQSWGLKSFGQRGATPFAWHDHATRNAWVVPESMRGEFRRLGYNQRRPFFPHTLLYLPKPGPDSLRLAGWMLGSRDPNRLWQILLYAGDAALEGLPPDLFFDDDLAWHRQQLHQPGHLAYACVVLKGQDLYGLNYVSDVVQRIGRRREYKTKIETRFRSWPSVLLNSMMAFAISHGKRRVFSPTADWVLRHTDPERQVDRALFDRVYDHSVEQLFQVRRTRKWWVIDVAENRDRIVPPEARVINATPARTISVCHDIERGWGHRRSHPAFAAQAEQTSRAALPAMLGVEQEMGVRATYHVVGSFLNEVGPAITAAGHGLGFHSYDHDLAAPQLHRCREVDYRVEGYRPPQSRLTAELADRNLCLHNFEWLASAAASLRTHIPRLENRVVKIPISFDDYPLFTGEMTYEVWQARALRLCEQNAFTAFSLHDCYAEYWLPHYPSLLEKVTQLGQLRRLDEVANELWLASAS